MKVKGWCPMGCGRTLRLSNSGLVCCFAVGCPRPNSVAEILDDAETEHIAILDEQTLSLQHPLRERLDGDLFQCEIYKTLHVLSSLPWVPGRYRVTRNPGQTTLVPKGIEAERLPDDDHKEVTR